MEIGPAEVGQQPVLTVNVKSSKTAPGHGVTTTLKRGHPVSGHRLREDADVPWHTARQAPANNASRKAWRKVLAINQPARVAGPA